MTTKRREAQPNDSRELFVTDDYRHIPLSELHLMFVGIREWLGTILRHKVLRRQPPPKYAIELGNWVKGDAQHISKRILTRLESHREQLAKLSFAPAFYANIPTVGPTSSAVMGMSRREGDVHALVFQSVLQVEDRIEDSGHFMFQTWLKNETVLQTCSNITLPAGSEVVDRVILPTDEVEAILKRHRSRIRGQQVDKITPADLFQRVDAFNRSETDDLVRRDVIRRASDSEVARLRKR